MENISSVLINIMIPMFTVLMLKVGPKLVQISVDQIPYLMAKLEILTYLQLQPKEEFGFSNKQEVVWNKKRDCLMDKK